MPEDNTPTGQEPGNDNPPAQDGGKDLEAKLAAARQEAAARRVELRELKQQWEQAQPLLQEYQEIKDADKSELEKITGQISDMQRQLDAANAQRQQAEKALRLNTLAVKANVPGDLLPYLDVSKFDLDDEDATLKALQALVPAKTANSGGPTNPARSGTQAAEETPEEWYKNRFQRPNIFGG